MPTSFHVVDEGETSIVTRHAFQLNCLFPTLRKILSTVTWRARARTSYHSNRRGRRYPQWNPNWKVRNLTWNSLPKMVFLLSYTMDRSNSYYRESWTNFGEEFPLITIWQLNPNIFLTIHISSGGNVSLSLSLAYRLYEIKQVQCRNVRLYQTDFFIASCTPFSSISFVS